MLQVSNSYLCRHRLASFAAYPQRNPVVWGPSIFFLAGGSEPDASGRALSVLINDRLFCDSRFTTLLQTISASSVAP